jgi:hypothetical protein
MSDSRREASSRDSAVLVPGETRRFSLTFELQVIEPAIVGLPQLQLTGRPNYSTAHRTVDPLSAVGSRVSDGTALSVLFFWDGKAYRLAGEDYRAVCSQDQKEFVGLWWKVLAIALVPESLDCISLPRSVNLHEPTPGEGQLGSNPRFIAMVVIRSSWPMR